MPAEWAEHECTLMAWPSRPSLWMNHFDEAKQHYAAMAQAVAAFEPVVMICRPDDAAEVARACGSAIAVEQIPIDDSWARDSGPIVVTDGAGRRAVVQLGFNGWGGKYRPYDKDARLATACALVLDLPVYEAPITTEGGAFFVDGEGTMITTDGAVLNDNRNPSMSRKRAEEVFADFLGVERVIWLDAFPDRDTDGHVDGIAQYVSPGIVALQVVPAPANPLHDYGQRNLAVISATPDARGRPLQVHPVEQLGYADVDGEEFDIPYLNFYLPNGGLIAPTGDPHTDEAALNRLGEIFPDREVVGVPGQLFSFGGGGPHCVTQQVPRG
jgi:agmatine deiminase